MAISVTDFWKLAIRSQAISLDEARSLHATFSRTPGAKHANSATVAEWLIDSSVLSRYQARQLLAGRPGPFVLGDYRVFDQLGGGPLAGLHRAVHAGSGQPALLFFCDADAGAPSDWSAAQQQAQAVLAARYPSAGRVFGMVEAEGRRFLVLEDNADQLPATAAPAPAAPRQRTAAPSPSRPLPLSSRPVAAAASPATSFDFDRRATPLPNDDFMSIPDTPVSFARKKQNHNSLLVFGGVGVVGVALLTLLVIFSGEPETRHETESTPVADSGTDATPPATTTDAPDSFSPPREIPAIAAAAPANSSDDEDSALRLATTTIADDGHTLWASPTDGPPVDLRYLANGAQMFLVVRPASILGMDEGEKVFAALGPRGERARAFVRSATGIEDLTEIERLLVAFYPAEGVLPQMSLVVTLREQRAKEDMLQAWNNPSEAGKEKKFYQGGAWAYYIPPEADSRTFAVAPPGLMTQMLELDGPPALRKEMEKLLRDTDDSRQLTLLLAPNFLFTEGRAILSGDMAKLKSPLLAYLGDGVLAAELSFQLGDEDFFAEMRVYSTLDTSPYELAEIYRTRLAELPEAIETYLSQLSPQPYGRFILTRMPRMIAQLAAFTRIADENKHAVLRCYLPASAAHNLTLATELALSESPGGVAVVATSGPSASPATLADALKQKISLSFPRNTLEKCMEMLAEEIGYPVHIEGADLQLEGITKNQSFGLDERGKPADEILRKVMSLANPDGKLVYVLRPLQEGGKDVVFVTTRAAVKKRGDKLPPELEQAPPKK